MDLWFMEQERMRAERRAERRAEDDLGRLGRLCRTDAAELLACELRVRLVSLSLLVELFSLCVLHGSYAAAQAVAEYAGCDDMRMAALTPEAKTAWVVATYASDPDRVRRHLYLWSEYGCPQVEVPREVMLDHQG